MNQIEPSPYIDHLLWLFNLQQAGFPFGADDLDFQTWSDLGLLNAAIEARRSRLM